MPIYVHESGERVHLDPSSVDRPRLDDDPKWHRQPDRQTTAARPAQSEPKEAWVVYALDVGVPSYEVHNSTKDELIARCSDGPHDG